jgi:hypothetical protein
MLAADILATCGQHALARLRHIYADAAGW